MKKRSVSELGAINPSGFVKNNVLLVNTQHDNQNLLASKILTDAQFISEHLKKLSKNSCLDDTLSDFYKHSNLMKLLNKNGIKEQKVNFTESVIEAGMHLKKDEHDKKILIKFQEKVLALRYFMPNRNAEIADDIELIEINANERVYSKNQKAKDIYFLVQGKLGYVAPNFTQKLPEDGVPINHQYFSGYYSQFDMVGAWEVIFNYTRIMTCIATEKTYLFRLKDEVGRILLGENLKKLLRSCHAKLKPIIYFKNWSEPQTAMFLDHIKLSKYKNNQIIYEAGESDESIYIINKGSVKIMYKYQTEDNVPVVSFPDPKQEGTQDSNDMQQIISAEQLQNKAKKIHEKKLKKQEVEKNEKNREAGIENDVQVQCEFTVKQRNKYKYGYSCLTTITEGESFGDEESIMNFSNIKRFRAQVAEGNTEIYKIDKRDFHMFASNPVTLQKIDKYCREKMARRVRYIADKLEMMANTDNILGSTKVKEDEKHRKKIKDIKNNMKSDSTELHREVKTKKDFEYQKGLEKVDTNITLFHNDKKNTVTPYHLDKFIKKKYGKLPNEDFSTVNEIDKFGELENPNPKDPPPIFTYKDFTDTVQRKIDVAKKFCKAQINRSRLVSNSLDVVSNVACDWRKRSITERDLGSTPIEDLTPAKKKYCLTYANDDKLNSIVNHESMCLKRMTKLVKDRSIEKNARTTRTAVKILKKLCLKKFKQEPNINFSHICKTKSKGIKFRQDMNNLLDDTYLRVNNKVKLKDKNIGLNKIKTIEKLQLNARMSSISCIKKLEETSNLYHSQSRILATDVTIGPPTDDQPFNFKKTVTKTSLKNIQTQRNSSSRRVLINELKKRHKNKKRSIDGIPYISPEYNERATLEGYRVCQTNAEASKKLLPSIQKKKEPKYVPDDWKQKLMESLKIIKNNDQTNDVSNDNIFKNDDLSFEI